MSWDLYVFDLPRELGSLDSLPRGGAEGLGRRAEIIGRILEAAPDADFSDPSWGVLQGHDWSVEINLGGKRRVGCIGFHLRGGDGAAAMLEVIGRRLNLRICDMRNGGLFRPDPKTACGFQARTRCCDFELDVMGEA
ncbi:MAG: hypothetical protein JO303_02150 [Caulobacteraceae bacterium]|nr:hypothetical protein [Caulobacteraceae bacterium]